METQEAKQCVRQWLQALFTPGADLQAVMAQHWPAEASFKIAYPFDNQDRDGATQHYYEPLFASFPDIARREDIMVTGEDEGAVWVGITGHYEMSFRKSWLGIPATNQRATLRFGEVYRVSDSGLTEAQILIDIPMLMTQAGVNPLPPSLGSELPVPGPATQDGLLQDAQPLDASKKTLTLVDDMLAGLGEFDGKTLESMAIERFWHPSMNWYGPCGIGTTRGIAGFQQGHQRDFVMAFPDRAVVTDIRFAEGNYAVSSGVPSMRGTHSGGDWLGLPATNREITMSVMDWWRREGDLLVENWVLIDLLDIYRQLGVDVLGRMEKRQAGSAQAPA
ncbi:ester cyclase [Halomonas sp. PR-M31]|uniref:nuclear transport factor 2 family protein n=1 Tax=Halomonas sp. PR-M31 TaxID=1471202 RepID=UPI00069CD6F8|nr:ester cyclase [Halomonas sp. PR-M31]